MMTTPMQANDLFQQSMGRAVEAFYRTPPRSPGLQKTFRLLEGTAQAMTRSAERLQSTAELTGKEIQATVTQVTGKVQSLYAAID